MPKVSVIMGVYNLNNREMLCSSIYSIINQTFADFEFIICDDGSDDGTYELLQEIAKDDGRIILIANNENMKTAATLNKCIERANGIYIARQDADDISRSDRLEKQVEFLDNNLEYSFVCSNVRLFDSNGVWGDYSLKANPLKNDFLFRMPFVHATVMMRRNELVALGGFKVTKRTRRNEDYELCMRMYANGQSGYNIQETLADIREDVAAYKRRKYKYRIDEAIIRYNGFKQLKMLPRGIFFVAKPLFLGLIPQGMLAKVKDKTMGRRVFK